MSDDEIKDKAALWWSRMSLGNIARPANWEEVTRELRKLLTEVRDVTRERASGEKTDEPHKMGP